MVEDENYNAKIKSMHSINKEILDTKRGEGK